FLYFKPLIRIFLTVLTAMRYPILFSIARHKNKTTIFKPNFFSHSLVLIVLPIFQVIGLATLIPSHDRPWPAVLFDNHFQQLQFPLQELLLSPLGLRFYPQFHPIQADPYRKASFSLVSAPL